MKRQPPVEKLIQLLDLRKDLRSAVEFSLKEANLHGISTLESFYDFLDRILTHIPTEKELMPSVREFYYLLSKSPGQILRHDQEFNKWMEEFVESRGNFLDTPESAASLDTFTNNPEYKIVDYSKNPSGWLSFNQFLARQVKPGKRPIAGPCDETIIVSPADCEFKGQWSIEEDSHVTAKGVKYSVSELLEGSAYRDKFANGVFTHAFLQVTDYHRYHVPLSGTIREMKIIHGRTWINEEKKADGPVQNIDDVGFQFTHTRGYLILETETAGCIALIPVGMGHISSVNFTPDLNEKLVKGDEFGYFAFGGSDIIMLFEPNKVDLVVKKGDILKQGEEMGRIKR